MNFFKKIFGGSINQSHSEENNKLNTDEIKANSFDGIKNKTGIDELKSEDTTVKDINKSNSYDTEKAILEITAGESIYKYLGINYNFIEGLYFIDEAQKQSILNFTKDAEAKFKLSDIDTGSKYSAFHSEIDKFYNYADNYKSKYQNIDYKLSEFFPYFSFEDFYKWEIQRVTEKKRADIVERVIENGELIASNPNTKEVSEFNIINKTHNGLNDISIEESTINSYLESSDKFKHYRISSFINCLVDYYLKLKDINRVENYFNILISKLEDDDKHKIEDDFISLLYKFESVGEVSKSLEYGAKGVDFIKSQFPTPKNKSMGRIYKEYITILINHDRVEEAKSYLNEALTYNEALKLSQLKSKLDKIL